MNVLLSIKPKHTNKIVEGNKRYEFRKSVFRQRDTADKVYPYTSSPVKQIASTFTIKTIMKEHPKELCGKHREFSGISEVEFFDYFRDQDNGYATKIRALELFDPVDPKDNVPDFVPTQSFCYTDKSWGCA